MSEPKEEYITAADGQSLTFTQPSWTGPVITIHDPSGKQIHLDLKDGVLDISGDLEITKAAQTFFDELKRIAAQSPS